LALVLVGCTASWQAPVESRQSLPEQRQPQRLAQTPRDSRPATAPSAYRVSAGDTLFGIAWQNGVDYRDIARWNGLSAPYRIYPGQVLRLRPLARTEAAVQPKPAPSPSIPKQTSPPRLPQPAPEPVPRTTTRGLAWNWPATGRVASTFNPSDPLRRGIRISGREGSDVTAAEGGRVVYSGSGLIGYGRLIIVKHNDNYLSAYGHNQALLVSEGDRVTKVQKIAAMGLASDGRPMLHFEIRRDGKPVDPLRLLPRR
jgi:lipoprotein NlpD